MRFSLVCGERPILDQASLNLSSCCCQSMAITRLLLLGGVRARALFMLVALTSTIVMQYGGSLGQCNMVRPHK